MQSERIKGEYVIHWGEVFKFVIKKWWILLLSAIVGAVGGFFAGDILSPNIYQSQALYLVSLIDASGDEGDLYGEYNTYAVNSIMSNCITVASQNKFMTIIADQINEGIAEESDDYMSVDQVSSLVSYTYVQNNTVLYVTVGSDSAELSYKIITAIMDNFVSYMENIPQVSGNNSIKYTLINTPTQATAPLAGTSKIVYSALFAVAFAVLAAAVLIVINLADTRIKRDTDLIDKYTLPVLGAIPYYDIEKTQGEGQL